MIGFINDLRHPQDDLIGLRAEAKYLIVCLNALYNTKCKVALHFTPAKQGEHLKTIVESCKLNVVDLDKFVAKCEKMAGIVTAPLAEEFQRTGASGKKRG